MNLKHDLVAQIAHVCYDAGAAYSSTLGIREPTWSETTPQERKACIKMVQASFRRSPSPADRHEEWLAGKNAAGWKFGPVKDEDKKQHPAIVHYEDLPREQRIRTYLFHGIVGAFRRAILEC